jgi:hypothetical protein
MYSLKLKAGRYRMAFISLKFLLRMSVFIVTGKPVMDMGAFTFHLSFLKI